MAAQVHRSTRSPPTENGRTLKPCPCAPAMRPTRSPRRSGRQRSPRQLRPFAAPDPKARQPLLLACSSSLLRSRMTFSKVCTRVPWSGSNDRTRRSKKRRRSAAGPVKSRSMDGVSQVTLMWRLRAPELFWATPSIFTWRPPPLPPAISGSDQEVPSLVSPVTGRALLPRRPIGAPFHRLARTSSAKGADLNPRPGASMEMASSRFVLPAPFGAGQHNRLRLQIKLQTGIVSKFAQRQPGKRQSSAATGLVRGNVRGQANRLSYGCRHTATYGVKAPESQGNSTAFGTSHPHGHQHVKGRFIGAVTHHCGRAGIGQHEGCRVAAKLAGNVEQIARIEPDFDGF